MVVIFLKPVKVNPLVTCKHLTITFLHLKNFANVTFRAVKKVKRTDFQKKFYQCLLYTLNHRHGTFYLNVFSPDTFIAA